MANLNFLKERASLLRHCRCLFDARGFYEVQPPCLSRDCVVDAYLDPITVDAKELGIADTRLPPRFYLQTSPESAMKRMLCAGAPSIYSIGPVFRSGECGDQHNIEFTMLEWYDVGGDAESAINLLGALAASVMDSDGYDSLSYQQAFVDRLEIDPLDASLEHLQSLVAVVDADLADGLADDRDGMLDVLLSECVAPSLGINRPVVLQDYPISQAALAKRSPVDPRCAARFELFIQGVEVANGYDELLDPEVLLARAHDANHRRRQSGRAELETQTTLLRAMREGMPACSGVALGFDRLLMLSLGRRDLRDVVPFMIWEA